jgi:hypothetical protein
MAIVCRQCGRPNVDGAQFCANPDCGAYLAWGGAAGPLTQPAPVVGGTPVRAAADAQNAAASLTLSDSVLSAVPGETATTTVTIHNGGTQVEQFAVRVIGPAAPWADVQPSALTVYPNSRGDCTIRLSPPRAPGTVPGRAWFTVRATSVLHPALSVGANGTLEVGAFRNLSATLTPQGTTGRWRTVHSIEVTNTGNLTEPVTIRADEQAGKLHFGVPAGEVPIPPGKHQINVPVRPQMRLFGRPQPYPFQLTVTPRQPVPPIPLSGNREAVPLIAGWVPKVVAVVAIVGAIAGAVALAGSKLPMFTTSGGASPAATAPAPPGGAGAPSAAPPPSAPPPTSAMPSPPPSNAPSPLPPLQFEAESLLPPVSTTATLQEQANCCNIIWSGNAQIFFTPTAAGNAFTLKFQVSARAVYDIVLVQTQAPDYGIATVSVDGQQMGAPFDGFGPAVAIHAPVSYGSKRLTKGAHTLTITVADKNASSANFFAGLDSIELDPANPTP